MGSFKFKKTQRILW